MQEVHNAHNSYRRNEPGHVAAPVAKFVAQCLQDEIESWEIVPVHQEIEVVGDTRRAAHTEREAAQEGVTVAFTVHPRRQILQYRCEIQDRWPVVVEWTGRR